MASSTRYGGASYTPEELADPDLPAVIIKRAELGYVDRPAVEEMEDESSLGNSSTPSTEKPPTSDDKPNQSPRKPARMTGNRSKQQESKGSSTAHSTDGDGRETGSQQSDDVDFDI